MGPKSDDDTPLPEGYTPLTDLQSSTAMFAVGPDSGGVFYADLNAFGHYDDDDEEDSSEPETNEEQAPPVDFRSLADGALTALEQEYLSTLRVDPLHTATKDVAEDDNELLPPFRLAAEDFGTDACFEGIMETVTNEPHAPIEPGQLPLPDIDTAKVASAVAGLPQRDKLSQQLAVWQDAQKRLLATPPSRHSIIPSAPLKAFGRSTAKAVVATHNLSRAATLAEALKRLDVMRRQERLRIDIVGCDAVECDRIHDLFAPLVRWMGAYVEAPRELELMLIGPNVPINITAVEFTSTLGRLESARATCQPGMVYEEYLAEADPPALAISFHSGLWGYAEWRPTIEYLAGQKKGLAFVSTAYTLQEAEDDAEVMEEELNKLGHDVKTATIWEAEYNPFASKKDRETASAAKGRVYRENAAWQAWRL